MTLGRRHKEGRALILQVTKSCQWRHRIATTLKDSFTFDPERRISQNDQKRREKAQITPVLIVPSSWLKLISRRRRRNVLFKVGESQKVRRRVTQPELTDLLLISEN